jgi:hypothetical protein
VAGFLSRVEEATKADAEAGIEASREKARDRWRKWDQKRRSNVGKRLQTPANNSRAVEDKPLPTDIEPQESKNRTPAKPSPRERLELVLDAERAEAVLDHRQRLRKPLTERAAKMLADELAKFPDPNAAADRLITKGRKRTGCHEPDQPADPTPLSPSPTPCWRK